MKPLPEVHIPYSDLYHALVQPIFARLLLTGIELNIFDRLCEPTPAHALAGAMGTHPGNTALLLNGLAAMGLVEKKDGLYSNAPVSTSYLSQESPTYIGHLLASSSNLWFRPLADNMSSLVREGPPSADDRDGPSEEMIEQYATDSLHYERAGIAQQVADLVSELPEFPAFTRMLDLGGGPGLIGLAVVARHPSMKGTVFDVPPVTRVAEKVIDEYRARDRMNTLSGDYLTDDIGSGYDLVLACSTLSAATGQLDRVIAKIRDSMTLDGVLVSLHAGLTHERTRPPVMVATMLSAAMFGPDPTFEQGEIAGSMGRAGFRSVESRTLATSMGPMDLDVGRK